MEREKLGAFVCRGGVLLAVCTGLWHGAGQWAAAAKPGGAGGCRPDPAGAARGGTACLGAALPRACLIDQQTGTILYEKNADQQMPIASITKVMTLLLTFEAVHDGRIAMDTLVPVSEHAYHMGGSQIWLEPGGAVHAGRDDQSHLCVLCQ